MLIYNACCDSRNYSNNHSRLGRPSICYRGNLPRSPRCTAQLVVDNDMDVIPPLLNKQSLTVEAMIERRSIEGSELDVLLLFYLLGYL